MIEFTLDFSDPTPLLVILLIHIDVVTVKASVNFSLFSSVISSYIADFFDDLLEFISRNGYL